VAGLEQGLEIREYGRPTACRVRLVGVVDQALVTRNRTMSAYGSISKVTRPGGQVVTRRRGGSLSTTSPSMSAMPEPSVRTCRHLEPTCQSDSLRWPQYSADRSASVSARQTVSGVLSMKVM
jgi:hypothetical protein